MEKGKERDWQISAASSQTLATPLTTYVVAASALESRDLALVVNCSGARAFVLSCLPMPDPDDM